MSVRRGSTTTSSSKRGHYSFLSMICFITTKGAAASGMIVTLSSMTVYFFLAWLNITTLSQG